MHRLLSLMGELLLVTQFTLKTTQAAVWQQL